MTIEQLEQVRDVTRPLLEPRLHAVRQEGLPGPATPRQVMLCSGSGCASCGHADVSRTFREMLGKEGMENTVNVVDVGCMGCCAFGLRVQIMPDNVLYKQVTVADVPKIIQQHFREGKLVTHLLHRETEKSEPLVSPDDMPFFSRQTKIVLENSGLIDPEVIDEYIARDGYFGLARALTELTPPDVIQELNVSRLRGRGGGGFAAGKKWQMLADAGGETKYVICNGDEGDPGAFMDRSVLESDPNRVLEGMAIAGYATGARHGVVYVRAEYPLAIKRVQIAINQARERGLLGARILGTDFSFDVEIRIGAGAFVCGEETALMMSVEGKRGMPRPRPPYPTDRGLYGCPTIINNVETFANVPPILRNGGAWFAQIGTPNSPGTKVFALAGAVTNTGLVEVPMGTTLRTLVFDIGGGVPGGREFKAAQTGGPSGGCIPAQYLDTPLDFDSLQSIGSIMGSGGLIVMDTSSCMVDVARFFMDFCVDESCGKCPPCRIGTHQLKNMLDNICEGRAREDEVERLEQLSALVSKASLCGLGMTAPNPVMSTIRHFRDEYMAHVRDKRCPAFACRKLITFSISADKCVGCSLCSRNCPVDTIFKVDGQKKFWIEQSKCIQCGTCFDVCRFEAVVKS